MMKQHEAKNSNDIVWLSLVEYAAKNQVSLSTLRRYIKSGKIEYQVRNGRYYLQDTESGGASPNLARLSLEEDLKRAVEEISELKMLVSLYEEKLGSRLGTN